MKPAKFEYLAPRALDEAIDILAASGEDAKVLAGGQSLVPSMNFRLARPARLVDINRIPGLDYLEAADGWLRIGALARHLAVERCDLQDPLGDLLHRAGRFVGHLPVRVRGTFAGSLAHADPAAEWCLLATTLGAEIVARSQRGERIISAGDFFDTVFTTALEPDELLTEARLPLLGPDSRAGFTEFSRRAGDFAIVAAAVLTVVRDGRIEKASIGLGGVGGRPLRAPEAEAVLVGEPPSPEVFAEAGAVAARHVTPMADIHGSAEYRRDLVGVLTRRALEQTIAA